MATNNGSCGTVRCQVFHRRVDGRGLEGFEEARQAWRLVRCALSHLLMLSKKLGQVPRRMWGGGVPVLFGCPCTIELIWRQANIPRLCSAAPLSRNRAQCSRRRVGVVVAAGAMNHRSGILQPLGLGLGFRKNNRVTPRSARARSRLHRAGILTTRRSSAHRRLWPLLRSLLLRSATLVRFRCDSGTPSPARR